MAFKQNRKKRAKEKKKKKKIRKIKKIDKKNTYILFRIYMLREFIPGIYYSPAKRFEREIATS